MISCPNPTNHMQVSQVGIVSCYIHPCFVLVRAISLKGRESKLRIIDISGTRGLVASTVLALFLLFQLEPELGQQRNPTGMFIQISSINGSSKSQEKSLSEHLYTFQVIAIVYTNLAHLQARRPHSLQAPAHCHQGGRRSSAPGLSRLPRPRK